MTDENNTTTEETETQKTETKEVNYENSLMPDYSFYQEIDDREWMPYRSRRRQNGQPEPIRH